MNENKSKAGGMPKTEINSVSPLAKMAMDKDLDPEKISQLLEVQKQWEANEAKKAFSKAMSDSQADMPMIVRTAENKQTHSMYAKHEMICKLIKPVYTSHGLSLTFHEGKAEKEGEIRVFCDVSHSMGHTERYFIDLPIDNAGAKGNVNKTPVHAKASTISYGHRYLTLMIFDLATYDDNDGNLAPDIDGISGEQSTQIHVLIKELETLGKPIQVQGLCTWAKAQSIETIPIKNFNRVVNELKGKIKKAQDASS